MVVGRLVRNYLKEMGLGRVEGYMTLTQCEPRLICHRRFFIRWVSLAFVGCASLLEGDTSILSIFIKRG